MIWGDKTTYTYYWCETWTQQIYYYDTHSISYLDQSGNWWFGHHYMYVDIAQSVVVLKQLEWEFKQMLSSSRDYYISPPRNFIYL